MSAENIAYRLLSELPKSETSDYWWWQGVRLLLEESLSFKESYGSLRCRGGIRNVPSVYDFQKKWNSAKQLPPLGDFQIVLATIEGNLAGLIVFSTKISAFQGFEGDAHKYEILSNNQNIISGSAFFDLGIVGRSFRHIGSGVFKGMISYVSKKIGCRFAYGLISPYNAYAQGVIQHYGAYFIPSSNNGLAHLCTMGKDFPYQKKGVQWLLFELPLEFNGKKVPSFPHKKVVSLRFECSGSAHGYKFNVFFEGGESGLDEETHGLLLDRIAGYAICTSSISDVEDGLTIPVFDYNNFRDGSLGEYDVISENVQGASYNAVAGKMSAIAEKRYELTQSYTQVLDICGGTHNKWNNLPFIHIKSYDARDGVDGCIDIHSLHNKFITDVQHADILLMQNAVARLYDYVRGPGRDYTQQEKCAFLRNVCNIHSDSGLDQHFLILESECVGVISFKEVCTQVCRFYPEAGKEWVAKWAAFWWYAISEKCFFPVLSDWRKNNLLGCFKIQDIQAVPQPDISTNSRRTVRLYVLSRMLNLIYKVSFVEATVLRDQLSNFTPGLLSKKCYADLLKKNRDTIGNNRIVDYLRKYQRFHALQNDDTAYAFVVTDATIVSATTESSLRDEIKALLLLVDVVYVCDGRGQEYYFSRFDSDVVGDPIVSCVSILNVNFLMLKTLLPDSVLALSEKKGVVSVTIGKYSPLLKGCSTLSANYFSEITINFNDVASIVRSLLNEINANVGKMWHDQVLMRSIKSAIGSIMSRNGSHNIGSHVLAALSHNVGTLPDDRVLYQYIQQRMDYIATVTTDFPTWTQSTMFVADMMKTFLSQRHLLDHIVESEGLKGFQFQNPNMDDREWADQKNCVRIHVRKVDSKGNVLEDFIKYGDKEHRNGTINLRADVALAIPGGIVGEHAFYTILENIIRNAAKHSWATGNNNAKNLDVYIDFTDEDEQVKFKVYAKLETSKCKKLVDELDQKLSQSFIDEDTGALRRENWGLAEMKISAGYLAGASIEAIGGIGDKKGTNEIIKPYVESSKYLGYEFFIAKPKEILIIVENKDAWKDKDGVMKKSGIFVKTIKEAKEELKLNYRYIVHYDATEFFDLKTKEPKEGILIPFRMLSGESVSSKSISQADKQNDGKKQDWEWLQPFVADLDDGVEKVENGNGFGQLKEAFEKGLVDGVRKIVYKAYYEHLRKSRNDFWSKCDNRNNEYDIKEIGLLVAINENEKAGGNSLISDADILELMLEQNFAVCVDQYKAFAANEDNRKIIKCLESIRHKSSAKDQVIKFKHFSNKTIREMIAQRMCDWAKKLIEKSNDSWNSIVEHLRKKYFVSDAEREPSNELRPSSNKTSDDFEANVNSLLQKHPIDDFIRYVESIFENTKKLFKQYEEQIVTLPAGYKINMLAEVKQENEGSDKKVALGGVEIVTNIEGVKDKDRHWIGYRRHAHTLPVDASKSLYVEPLSGTQTYLSQLTKVKDNLGLQMRLIENGLMRILVLDERVAKFLREHQNEVGPHYKAMNIHVIDHEWVVAGGETPSEGFYEKFTSKDKEALKSFVKPQESNKSGDEQKGSTGENSDSSLTQLDDVDILIVHQGVLDKWYPEFKNRKDMSKLLEGFKKLVKYVVVTTGRGTPENIPEEAHLLPFAVVESTLFKKYPEKLILTDTIMNVLPVGKKNDNSGGQE